MHLPAKPSECDARKDRLFGFPFVSPAYDRFSVDGARCCDLLDNDIRLSETSTAACFAVANGAGCMSSIGKAEIRALFVDLMGRPLR